MAWVELWEWCSKGRQSIVSCEGEVHREPEATYVFRMKKQKPSTFRCTRVSSANVIWFVMTDQAIHICQSHSAVRQSRWYSSTYVWVWDTVRLFVAKRELLHLYNQSWGAPENRGQIFVTDPALHICQSHLAIKTDKAILSSCVKIWDICSHICGKAAAYAGIPLKFWNTSDPHPRELEAETRLGYSWLRCCSHCQGFPGLWLRIIHNWDFQSCPEWASWICTKPTWQGASD